MSQSDGSTIPCTPEVFAEDVDVNKEGVFAWLRPFNDEACSAFDATVNTVLHNIIEFAHFRQFLYLEGKNVLRAGSVFTEDENAMEEPGDASKNERWSGAFRFHLDSTGNDSLSWRLGSGCSPEKIDILLAPGDGWKRLKVAHSHARLYMHRGSYRMMLEARHTVTIGRNCLKPVTNQNSHVVEHGEIVIIGACTFTFEYTDFSRTPTFEMSLQRILNASSGSEPLNHYLSPTSVGVPVLIGDYYCSPSAFAQGTFGTVSAGWTRDGTAVAIKRIKNPRKAEVLSHREIMEFIGNHANILQLLDCVSHFDTSVPDAYCVYAPVALGSLRDVITMCKIDILARMALLKDFLQGLSYLHDQKNIWHRDINPNNLAVISYDNPKGIILDLDSATRSSTSMNHTRGTLPYLAPEIVDLKDGRDDQPFEKSVDIWALGLSMFDMYEEDFLLWLRLPPREKPASNGAQPRNSVTPGRYKKLQERIKGMKGHCKGAFAASFIHWIEDMTEYSPKQRHSASALLSDVSAATAKLGRGTIVLRSLGYKRSREV